MQKRASPQDEGGCQQDHGCGRELPPDEAGCEEAAKFVHQQFKVLDDWFENTAWLANDTFSIADPFALAYVEQANVVDFPLDGYPRIKAWFDRLEAADSTAKARSRVQPHVQALMAG